MTGILVITQNWAARHCVKVQAYVSSINMWSWGWGQPWGHPHGDLWSYMWGSNLRSSIGGIPVWVHKLIHQWRLRIQSVETQRVCQCCVFTSPLLFHCSGFCNSFPICLFSLVLYSQLGMWWVYEIKHSANWSMISCSPCVCTYVCLLYAHSIWHKIAGPVYLEYN